MAEREYTYELTFDQAHLDGEWRIRKRNESGFFHPWDEDGIVARFPHSRDDADNGRPPVAVRQEFERLTGLTEFADVGESPVNIVEILADGEDCAFDQPCSFGHRVEQHAVYCHNDSWLYAPRKCRRSDDWPHAECPGFLANASVGGLLG